jgi:hypothetical protein
LKVWNIRGHSRPEEDEKSTFEIQIARAKARTEPGTVSWRVFNLFNHPNFGPPDNNITDALFGYSTRTRARSLGSGGANGGLNPLY